LNELRKCAAVVLPDARRHLGIDLNRYEDRGSLFVANRITKLYRLDGQRGFLHCHLLKDRETGKNAAMLRLNLPGDDRHDGKWCAYLITVGEGEAAESALRERIMNTFNAVAEVLTGQGYECEPRPPLPSRVQELGSLGWTYNRINFSPIFPRR
jgi:hypothetical protein